MLRRPIFATWFVSSYLLLYVLFLSTDSDTLFYIADGMALCSPILLIWMTYTIIRFGTYTGRTLQEGEEFGYEDRS